MWGFFPRDPLLIGRLGACVGAVAWLALGGQGILPIAVAALVFLICTSIGDAADRAMYRQKQLARKRTTA